MKYLNFELEIEEIKYLLQQKLDRDYAEYKMKVYIQPNDFQNEEEYRNLMRKGEPVAILFADEKKFMKQMFIPPISELSKDFILCLEAKNELKNNKKEREYICDGGSFYDVLIDGANIIIIAKNENREFHRYLRNDLCFDSIVVNYMLKHHNKDGQYEEEMKQALKTMLFEANQKAITSESGPTPK